MKWRKAISIYLSGFLVGITLVLYPAAGNLFTDAEYHGFSSAQFGSIFIPQIILAIITSLAAPKMSKRWSMKVVMIMGLISLLLSALLMSASYWFMSGYLDYILVMIGTAFLGAGFGFTITALNPFAYNLFEGYETAAVTSMHILLGVGTATSALFLDYFVESGIWYVAPLIIAAITLAMILFTLPLSLTIPDSTDEEVGDKKIPTKVWIFGLAVFLYGACEATFGNWGSIFLIESGGLSTSDAALGLSLFWGFVAIGRILFTFYSLKYPPKWIYLIAPFLVAIVFYQLSYVEGRVGLLSCMAMGGFTLSILFPLSISTATEQFPRHAALISGLLVAAIQLGTGFSSNLIGFLKDTVSLPSLFQLGAIYAGLLGILVFYLVREQTEKNSG